MDKILEYIPEDLLVTLVTIAVALGAILGRVSYLILLERKLSAWMQDRVGPNRVGPFGLLQPIADGAQVPAEGRRHPGDTSTRCCSSSRRRSRLFTTMLAFAVVPFGPVGVEGVPGSCGSSSRRTSTSASSSSSPSTSLAVYGVILGGWASNNKYSALGSLRASAQVVSYEIPLGMSVLGIALLGGTLEHREDRLTQQATGGFWRLELLDPAAGLPDLLHQRAGRSRTACRSTCPSASRNWSADSTPNTAR